MKSMNLTQINVLINDLCDTYKDFTKKGIQSKFYGFAKDLLIDFKFYGFNIFDLEIINQAIYNICGKKVIL